MLLAGCYPQIPEGVFRCQVGSECPPGQRCSAGYCRAACAVEEVEVERACYARSVDLDGGLNAGMEQKPDSGVAARERDAAAVDTAAPAVDGARAPAFVLVDLFTIAELDAALVVTFSAALDARTLTPTGFRVSRAGRVVEGELTADGASVRFKPTRGWVLGADYKLELTSELRDDHGLALAPDTRAFEVRAGAWSSLRPGITDLQYADVQVALHAQGRAALLFNKAALSRGLPATLDVSLESPGGAWSAPKHACDNPNQFLTGHQRIQLADDGRGVVACGDEELGTETAAVVFDATNPPRVIERPRVDARYIAPSLTTTPAGIAFEIVSESDRVAYADTASYPALLRFALDDARATKTALAQAGTNGDVAALGEGAVAVWQEAPAGLDGGTRSRVMSAALSADGTCVLQGGSCGRALSTPDTSATNPRVSSNRRTRAAIVWEPGGVAFITATPSGPVWQPQDVSSGASQVAGVDDDGNAVLVFLSQGILQRDGTRLGMLTFSEATQHWSDVSYVSSTAEPEPPQLAVSAGGSAVLAWMEGAANPDAGPNLRRLRTAIYNPVRGWTRADQQLYDDTIDGAPSVAIDDSGRAAVAWLRQREVFLLRYR